MHLAVGQLRVNTHTHTHTDVSVSPVMGHLVLMDVVALSQQSTPLVTQQVIPVFGDECWKQNRKTCRSGCEKTPLCMLTM